MGGAHLWAGAQAWGEARDRPRRPGREDTEGPRSPEQLPRLLSLWRFPPPARAELQREDFLRVVPGETEAGELEGSW